MKTGLPRGDYNMGTPPQYGDRGLSSLGRKVSPKADVAQGVILRSQEVNSNSFAPLAARAVDSHMLCHEPIMFDGISWKAPSIQRVRNQKRFENSSFEKFSKLCDV